MWCIHQVRNNKNSDWVSSSSSELAVNNKKFPINMNFYLSAAVTASFFLEIEIDGHQLKFRRAFCLLY